MRRSSQEPCRYYANGICNKGNSCMFVHDPARRNENVCQFNLAGKCSYGQSCRFLHIRPRNEARSSSSSVTPNFSVPPPPIPSRSTQRVRPVRLSQPGLNAEACEFVPSWKIKSTGSYASAAACSSSSSSTSATSNNAHLQTLYLCPYYEKNGECHRKDTDCPFAHGDRCDMCNSWSLHPFNEQKRKEHVTECVDLHSREMERAFLFQKTEDKSCGICMENIVEKNLRFGILNGCQHCFCLDCIRQWRSRDQQSMDLETKTVRSCPECRQHSDYVIPSVFWVEAGQEKNLLIEMYKENMKAKVCKYYSNTNSRGDCPFGNKCFYKHQLPDGSIDPGEPPHLRRRPQISAFLGFDDDDDDNSDFDEDALEYDILEPDMDTMIEDFLRTALNGDRETQNMGDMIYTRPVQRRRQE